MSAWGRERTLLSACATSALVPKTDMACRRRVADGSCRETRGSFPHQSLCNYRDRCRNFNLLVHEESAIAPLALQGKNPITSGLVRSLKRSPFEVVG